MKYKIDKMRTIKFRAWDKDNNKMIYQKSISGEEIVDYDISIIIGFDNYAYILDEDEHGRKFIIESGELIPMEFTGLTDKNGKEIWEGDILILSGIFGSVKSENNNPAVFEVKKQGCDYILKRPDMDFDWGRLSRVEELSWECEIIGNIYENPEPI